MKTFILILLVAVVADLFWAEVEIGVLKMQMRHVIKDLYHERQN